MIVELSRLRRRCIALYRYNFYIFCAGNGKWLENGALSQRGNFT